MLTTKQGVRMSVISKLKTVRYELDLDTDGSLSILISRIESFLEGTFVYKKEQDSVVYSCEEKDFGPIESDENQSAV